MGTRFFWCKFMRDQLEKINVLRNLLQKGGEKCGRRWEIRGAKENLFYLEE